MTDLVLLSQWAHKVPNRIVTITSAGDTVHAQRLLERAARWVQTLQPLPGQRWAVYHRHPVEFSAILMALWQLRRTACLPGDNLPGTVSSISNLVTGFLGEFSHPTVIHEPAEFTATETNWQRLSDELLAVEVFTSGSTGKPELIAKRIRQLDREITSLDGLWPAGPEPTPVLSTVSHQHIYGLLFRILWPLCSGRPILEPLCNYTEDIIAAASEHASCVLVSSPSHLSRLNSAADWPRCHGRFQHLFSSSAPLKLQDSLNVTRLTGAPVQEIYGSSETGGIAWRCQHSITEEASWTPMPGVRLTPAANANTRLKSPHAENPDGMLLPDNISLEPNGDFKLLGRRDRIVKVEGKRVSLTRLETLLLDHHWIADVRLLVLERSRVEIAAVVELSADGHRVHNLQGRRTLIRNLKQRLSEHTDAVAVPRKWRFVDSLPFNAQGKVTLKALQELFVPSTWPQLMAQTLEPQQAILELAIPTDLIYFDGHFNGAPILPGVVQIHWAEGYGRKLLGVTAQFMRLEAIKFQQVIQPRQQVTLSLKYQPDKMKLLFKFESDKGPHSSGRICFGGDGV